MADLHITSASNPRLKELVALRRRRTREETGSTLLEGTEELSLALEAGVTPYAVYHCPELMQDYGPEVVETARAAGAQVVELSRTAFDKVAYREGPDGVLAKVPAPGLSWDEVELPAHPFVLLVEGVEKPGNLGAMLRTADAAGVDLVVAADCVTDWGNPNVVRGSKGTVFSVPVASASTVDTLKYLRDNGIRRMSVVLGGRSKHSDRFTR